MDLGTAALVVSAFGFLAPVIVASLRGRATPPEVIGLILLALCIVFAFLSMLVTDQLGAVPIPPEFAAKMKTWAVFFLTVFGAAVVMYQGFWKSFGAHLTESLERSGPAIGANPAAERIERGGR